MKFLTSVVETYRVDTSHEVDVMVDEAKKDESFSLAKYKCDAKEVKSKGEVLDSYYLLSLTKVFNDPKDPVNEVAINYEVN